MAKKKMTEKEEIIQEMVRHLKRCPPDQLDLMHEVLEMILQVSRNYMDLFDRTRIPYEIRVDFIAPKILPNPLLGRQRLDQKS